MRLPLRSTVSRAATPLLVRAIISLCDFSAVDWDSYHVEHGDREWLLPYDGPLAARLDSALRGLPHATPLLELGCGTSDLAARLFDEGWHNVTAVDLSPHAVATATDRHGPGRPGLSFSVGDARHLASIPDGSYGAVVDKGTLDAVCCGEGFDYEARRVFSSVARVLAPSGRWMCVSLLPPSVFLPLLAPQRADWPRVHHEPLRSADGDLLGLHLYVAQRGRRGAPTTRWHWHPIEGGWHTRVRSCAV